MLRLPDGVFFLGDSKLGSRLYVRPVYGPLFEALLTEKSVNSKRLFVITGTAGIGKSFFLLYALWRFAVMAAPPPRHHFRALCGPTRPWPRVPVLPAALAQAPSRVHGRPRRLPYGGAPGPADVVGWPLLGQAAYAAALRVGVQALRVWGHPDEVGSGPGVGSP